MLKNEYRVQELPVRLHEYDIFVMLQSSLGQLYGDKLNLVFRFSSHLGVSIFVSRV